MIPLLYPKIAARGIRKNKQLYIPFFISSILMVAVFYIVHFLGASNIAGSSMATNLMAFGSFIVALFAAIVLFYTHATLFKGRIKEFGLYRILGMNKRNIAKIIFYENLFTWLISVICGLIFGIAFSKLAQLGFSKITDTPINYTFSINKKSVFLTLVGFSIIFKIIYINTIRKIAFMCPIENLRASQTSEKPVRANWLLGLLGLCTLGSGYFIALTIVDPLTSSYLFFAAVTLVIIGTFLILISVSVLLCKVFQKNKNYYYKTNHFISVSSMAYRIRRNGAGLAAICVLLTMTLVTISTTASLYSNIDRFIDTRFPCDINAFAIKFGYGQDTSEYSDDLTSAIVEKAKAEGADAKELTTLTGYSVCGRMIDDEVVPISFWETGKTDIQYVFMDIDDYNKIFDCNEQLGISEAIVASTRDTETPINIADLDLSVIKHIDNKMYQLDPLEINTMTQNIVYIFVQDCDRILTDNISKFWNADDSSSIKCIWKITFNTDIDTESKINLANDIDNLFDERKDGKDFMMLNCYTPEDVRHSITDSLGGMLFLGSLLSIIFLISSFVMMYYKQISEGFEDQSHFTIMQKVGMTKKEIRKSIESQMFTLFFIPITLACINLIVALPLISKILYCLGVYDPMILVVTAGICVLCCGLIYVLAYKKTSNSYYKIVSN